MHKYEKHVSILRSRREQRINTTSERGRSYNMYVLRGNEIKNNRSLTISIRKYLWIADIWLKTSNTRLLHPKTVKIVRIFRLRRQRSYNVTWNAYYEERRKARVKYQRSEIPNAFNVETRMKCAKERLYIDLYGVNTVSIFRTIPVGASKFCFHTRSYLHFPCDIKKKHNDACSEYYSNKGDVGVTSEMSTKGRRKKKRKAEKKKRRKSGPASGSIVSNRCNRTSP